MKLKFYKDKIKIEREEINNRDPCKWEGEKQMKIWDWKMRI